MKAIHQIVLPQDEISFHFIKLLSKILEEMGFSKSFEHIDPNGIDTYRYETKDGQIFIITRTYLGGDKVEIKVQTNNDNIRDLINQAADSFGDLIADSIKKGGTMGL